MTRKQKMALVVSTGTSFATAFSGNATNLAIPSMGNYFHMGAAEVGWITIIYMLVLAALSVPFGKIADSTSRRDMLITGVAIFGIASVFAAFAWSPASILSARAVQGIGAAMLFASNMPIAISAFPGNERGKAIGIVTTGVYAGLALGPGLGGLLNYMFSWKAIFIFGALIVFVSLAVAIAGLEKDRQESGLQHFDLGGNLVYIVMVSCLVYGFSALNSFRFGWAFLLLGGILGVVFVLIERRAKNPVIDVRIFAEDRVFTLSNLAALFNYSATFALGYLVSIYLQVTKGLTSQIAGIIMITQPLFMAMLAAKAGRMSDRGSAYKIASSGMALCAVSLLFFTFANAQMPIWAVCIALAVAGTGIALFSSPNTNIIMGCVPPAKYAVANTILSTMRTMGMSSGMAIITIVVNATVGNVSLYEVPPLDLVHTMHIAFAIFTGLCVLGIFMSLQRRKA